VTKLYNALQKHPSSERIAVFYLSCLMIKKSGKNPDTHRLVHGHVDGKDVCDAEMANEYWAHVLLFNMTIK
jgi:hypothetical protein